MEAFWLSLAMIFLAELGDKTQLVALCLATRFRVGIVLSGVFAATLCVHLFSVGIGGGVARFVPEAWIKLAAGIAFIVFGLWTLRGDCLSKEECSRIGGRSPFWITFTTFFLAELGDKTMLSTVTLATDHSAIPVWIGSSLGMVISDGLAITVGQIMGRRLPERTIRIGAACVFFAFGAFSLVQGASNLPPTAWGPLAAVGVGTAIVYVWARSRRREQPAACPEGASDPESDVAAGSKTVV